MGNGKSIPVGHLPVSNKAGNIRFMDLNEIRRRNLRALMDRTYGRNARGAQSRMAEALGKPQNYLSRCLYEPEKKGAKNIGEDFAREIERAFKL
jgi:hypothetical protein